MSDTVSALRQGGGGTSGSAGAMGSERFDGGGHPNAGVALQRTMTDFTANMAPYVMGGVGLFLIRMVFGFVAVFFVYFVMGVIGLGGIFGTAILGAAVGSVAGDDAGGLVAALGLVLTYVLVLFSIFPTIAVLASVLAPFHASADRAVAAYQRGEEELTFAAPFATFAQDLVSAVLVVGIVAIAASIGTMFFILPGFAVSCLCMYAPQLVFLHRKGPIDAIRTSVRTVMSDPQSHGVTWLMFLAIGMVANYVPVIGPMFMVALHVRVYREVFGDGQEAVLAAQSQ